MTVYLVVRNGYDDDVQPRVWSDDKDVLDRWLLEHPPNRYEWLDVWRLNGDGTIEEIESHVYVSERYGGALVRAKVQMMNLPDHFHRVPIDCARPRPDRELTEDYPYRVIATSCCGASPDREHQHIYDCHCGDWQEIEGSPEKVAELVEKYGVSP